MIRPSLTVVAGLVVAIGATTTGSRQHGARPLVQDSVVVALRSGPLTLSAASTEAFFARLRAEPSGAMGFAAFRRHLSAGDRAALDASGLAVVSWVGARVYRVRAGTGLQQDDDAVRSLLTLATPLRPRDRVEPSVWNAPPDSTMRLQVTLWTPLGDTVARQLIGRAGRALEKVNARRWTITVPAGRLHQLAETHEIQWIDAASTGAGRAHNDVTRGEVGVTALQNFSEALGKSLGLGGSGIRVGVFDDGIDEAHIDFRQAPSGSTDPSRVILTDPIASHHGTIVAGVLVGNGANSTTFAGTPYQWRGMAPEATLLEVVRSPLIINAAELTEKFGELIIDHGMHVSNHSYAVEPLSAYGELTALRDAIIRGDAARISGSAIPARAQVFSVGNDGGSDGTGPAPGATSAKHGYFSIAPGETKNGISVGSWRSSSDRIVGSSSLGPTRDGRIKPDLVAPGSQIVAPGYWSTWTPGTLCPELIPGSSGPLPRRNVYVRDCGTSLAAPVVTGVIAQLLQHWFEMSGAGADMPLPSGIRALLLHSATDQAHDAGDPDWFGNPDGPVRSFAGPDVATGFGLLNAPGAVDLINRHMLRTGSIIETCSTQTYELNVVEETAGEEPTVKITLAWDDPAADLLSAAKLVNDLDLVVEDPSGTKHYPWQVNQVVTSTDGAPLSPAEQSCNTPIVVDQKLPSTGLISASALAAAHSVKAPDHLNNVEQVVATGPAGVWKVTVSGFAVPFGPQPYSLVGVPVRLHSFFNPVNLCAKVPALCELRLFDLCRRYPPLCDRPQIHFLGPQGPRVLFRGPDDRVILPLRELCAAMRVPGGCGSNAGHRIDVTVPREMSVALYSGTGQRVAGDEQPRRTTRLDFRPARDTDYFMIIAPSAAVRYGAPYDVRVAIRR